MPDIPAFVKINNFFGDIDSVVANAFETVRDAVQAQGARDGVGIFEHEAGEFTV